jgi:hypothetical protein
MRTKSGPDRLANDDVVIVIISFLCCAVLLEMLCCAVMCCDVLCAVAKATYA